MAESGKTPIQLYHSTDTGVVPSAANLLPGELAINITDNCIWTDDGTGSIKKIVGSLAAQEANNVAITGGTITGVAVESDTAFVTLQEQTDDPVVAANTGVLYTKESAGTTSLYYQNDDGNVIKITEGNSLNIELPDATIEPQNTLTEIKTSSRFYNGQVVDVTPVGGTATISWVAGSTFNLDLSSEAVIIDFTNMPVAIDAESQVIWIIVRSTGTCTISSFTGDPGFTLYKPSAAEPLGALTTNGIDVFTCSMQGTNELFIFPVFDMVPL